MLIQNILPAGDTKVATKKPNRKFGLAWLFSYEEEEAIEAELTEVVDIDERIRGTWMTLEASKRERRVEATTRHYERSYTFSKHLDTIITVHLKKFQT